jgi:hypothetical protein
MIRLKLKKELRGAELTGSHNNSDFHTEREYRKASKAEIAEIILKLRQIISRQGLTGQVKVNRGYIIINKLRLRKPVPNTQPFEKKGYRIRNEFGIVYADYIPNNRESIEVIKVRKARFLQPDHWADFRDNIYDLVRNNFFAGSFRFFGHTLTI